MYRSGQSAQVLRAGKPQRHDVTTQLTGLIFAIEIYRGVTGDSVCDADTEAPVDELSQAVGQARVPADRRHRIAEAGGQLVAAAVRLLGELLPGGDEPTATASLVRDQLAGALETDPKGRPMLALTLPDQSTLDSIARVVAGLLTRGAAADVLVN